MRLLALLMSAATTLSAAEMPFYIGTYTNKTESKGIYLSHLDTATGKLGPIELAVEASDPNFLAIAPGGKFLYAATREAKGSVAAFAIEPDDKLRLLNEVPSGGLGTCHVATDGRNLLAANYTSGSVVCFSLKPDGSLGAQTALIALRGTGPNTKRQESPHAHSVYIDKGFAYAGDLGSDTVWSFRYDATTGSLTPTDPAGGKTPPGGGPRHVALHPGGKFAYACNEMGLSVTAFSRDPVNGTLMAMQTLSTLPDGVSSEGSSTAECLLHPSGKWLYVSNRGHDSIAVFAVQDDGKLAWVETVPAQVQVPRGFGIDPTGRWLIAAGQKDNKIAVLEIDSKTGRLTPTGEAAGVPAPVCLVFVPR